MADTDYDPQAFLKTVRDLTEKKDREDLERYERLEQQILEDRAARLERKLERERSLSPEKTPQSIRSYSSRTDLHAASPVSPTKTSPTKELSRSDSLRSTLSDRMSPAPSERPTSPTKTSSPSAAMPSRANTMSWQRRPQPGSRNRPLSLLAAENSASRATRSSSPDSRPASQDGTSRDYIAKNLASKDPSWFRQTADRAEDNPAHRRAKIEEPAADLGLGKRELFGLAPALSMSKTVQTSGSISSPLSSQKSPSPPILQSTTPDLPSASRTLSQRPVSPTRSMGGFVESAMMKRTDSVNKRYGSNSGELDRSDSVSSFRGSFSAARGGLTGSSSMPRLEPSRSTSPTKLSSGLSIMNLEDDDVVPDLHHLPSSSPTRTGGSLHSRSRSHASLRESPTRPDIAPTFSPPLSPSKRWNSTKSSWLESALARPESPTKSPQLDQPTWMAELSRNKASRDRADPIDGPWADKKRNVSSTSSTKLSTTEVLPAQGANQAKRDFTPPTRPKPTGLTEKLSIRDMRGEGGRSAVDTPTTPKQVSNPLFSSAPNMTSPPIHSPDTKIKKTVSPTQVNLQSSPRPPKPSTDSKPGDQLEFRNALGNLKRATTKNYVAPDVLKNNILRGKAELNITGGPQKTKRVDEFKESILQKKAEMREKGPEVAPKPFQKASVPAPTPEALEIRKGLQRSSNSVLHSAGSNDRRDITPEALSRHKTLKAKPSSLSSKPALTTPPAKPSAQTNDQKVDVKDVGRAPSSKSALTLNQSTTETPPSVGSRTQPHATSVKSTTAPQEPNDQTAKEPSASVDSAKSNIFANRFNPALAGLLARGPPAQSPQSKAGSEISLTRAPAEVAATANEAGSKGGDLTHMTKGRAKGPKRRKPASKTEESAAATKTESAYSPLGVDGTSDSNSDRPSRVGAAFTKSTLVGQKTVAPSPNSSFATPEDNKENMASPPSVKSAASKWGTTTGQPIKVQTIPTSSKQDNDAAMRAAALLSSAPARTQPPAPVKSSRVVSQTLVKSPTVHDVDQTTPRASTQPVSAAERAVTRFFGSLPNMALAPELDAQPLLTVDRPSPGGRTLRKTVQLISESGKLSMVPADQEYILFSSSMYIITHIYGSASGQKLTEVLLWSGSDVSPSAVEDALVFAKRIAKEAATASKSNPTVTVTKHGSEPATLFQALGGIVIFRNGSPQTTTSRPYMLCGRSCSGHIAFDEVPLSTASLCSAFPYILVRPTSGQDAQIYLWVGKSCGSETTGSARLISMDLSASDVAEIDEGKESADFLSIFPTDQRDTKSLTIIPPTEKFSARLFRLDRRTRRRSSTAFFGLFGKRAASPPRPTSSHRPTSSTSSASESNDACPAYIGELSPFSQDDFEPEHMYMLDCIDQVLLIPGPLLASSHSHQSPDGATRSHTDKERDTIKTHDGTEVDAWEYIFTQACLVANDYAVLAAGAQDRPAVPKTSVLLAADLPREAKMLFRAWDERRGLWGAAGLMVGSLGVDTAQGRDGLLPLADVLDVCRRRQDGM